MLEQFRNVTRRGLFGLIATMSVVAGRGRAASPTADAGEANQPERIDLIVEPSGPRLAEANGASLIGYASPGQSPRLRTVAAKLGEQRALTDKAGGASSGLLAASADLPDGGAIHVPRGTHRLSTGVRFSGQRLLLKGEASNVAILQFDGGGTCLDFDSGGGGGQYQSAVTDLGFYAPGMRDKTAIRARNVANLRLENIGIAGGNWRGANAVGIWTLGRELVDIRGAVLNCARPVLFGANSDHPTLCTDHFRLSDSLLQSDSTVHACLEFDPRCIISNTTIQGVAFVNGRDGIRWNAVSAPRGLGASMHLRIADCRFEQGLNPAGWCIDLRPERNGLQELTIENCRIDTARNGVRLRNVLRAKFDAVTFDSVGRTALDVVMVPGGLLEFIGCTLTGGEFSIANGRCIRRVRGGRARGFSETWVYDTGSLADRAVLSDTAQCTAQLFVPAGEQLPIADASFSGRISIGMRNGHCADFQVMGASHRAIAIPASNVGNHWTDVIGTAGKSNLQFSPRHGHYMLENATPGPADYWYTLIGSAW